MPSRTTGDLTARQPNVATQTLESPVVAAPVKTNSGTVKSQTSPQTTIQPQEEDLASKATPQEFGIREIGTPEQTWQNDVNYNNSVIQNMENSL